MVVVERVADEEVRLSAVLRSAVCDWIGDVYERYNGNCDYPKKFLSYNFIYPSCAGFSFFYDVEKAVLYARWGSN